MQTASARRLVPVAVVAMTPAFPASTAPGATIARLAAEHDVAFSCEPTGGGRAARSEGLLVLGSAGTARATLTVVGRASHAGVAPEAGRNALSSSLRTSCTRRATSPGSFPARS
jgi:hypothetical protein